MAFFSQGELAKVAKKTIKVDQLEPDCFTCGLNKTCSSPKIKVSGEGRKKILVISEFPTEDDDDYGSALTEEPGELLGSELKKHGISLNKDCWKINAVSCRPPKGRIPTHSEIKCCFPKLDKLIKTLKPKLILSLGSFSNTALFGEYFSNRSVDRWRGYEIPDQRYGCFILPLFPPHMVLLKEKDKNLRYLFNRDIKRVPHCLNRTFKAYTDYEQYVTILTDYKAVVDLLNRILARKQKIAFDYETTGLKPQRTGHKLSTIGIAVSTTKAFAFPFNYKSFWTESEFKTIKNLWKQILRDKDIKKIAQNSKFEDNWSKILVGTRIRNIHWDTMMASRILDNRRDSTGLKFQTYVSYGILPYDKFINPFLTSKNGEFNTIEKAPFKELLLYNGLDCIYTFMKYKDQTAKLPRMKNMYNAYKFFMRGLRTMGTIQLNGICIDMDYYRNTEKELEIKIKELNKYLHEGWEARKFKESFGKEINIASNQDLGKLFYEVLGKLPIKTAAGNYKTDKTTLEKLNLPFVDKLLEIKKLEKVRGTYLAQFVREEVNGKIYPFWDLHIPVSYRSSGSRPNMQNIPSRDQTVKNLVRRGIVPAKNCRIGEQDFGGAETVVSAAYHKDPQFIHDITVGDMHRDLTMELFMIPFDLMNADNPIYDSDQKKKIKNLRFYGKNNWTFAQFYGDWFGSCAPNLWANVVEAGLLMPNGVSVKEHLESKGIYELGWMEKWEPTPGSFLEHCKKIEDQMWNVRFSKYTQWKKDIVEFYQKYGFIENFFGFRFQGYMDKKQCTNFPIQSASFHLLVYTLNEVQKVINKNKLRTRIIGQVHDSILSNIHKDETEFYVENVERIVASLPSVFPWLIVPMEIETDLSDLRENGGNFADMKTYTLEEIKKL
jgi:uracil-DNA glycosylase family 4